MKAREHSINSHFLLVLIALSGGCVEHQTAPVAVYSAPSAQGSATYTYSNQTPYQAQPGVQPPPLILSNTPPEQPPQAGLLPVNQPVATQAPPPVQAEVAPPSPGAGYYWTPGHWFWRGNEWVWVNGGYVLSPRPGAIWVDGRWERHRWGWVWVEGRWRY